jgi:ferritin-like metal-binding protein YciE
MAKAASNEELKQAFEDHLEETRGHVERLEQAFAMLDVKAKSKPCEAMKGLVKEGSETTEEDFSEPLLDSAIICAAQKVEHYEIAGYGTLIAWANSIGLEDVAEIFEETLREEREADEKLTQIGGEILTETAQDQETDEPVVASRKAGKSASQTNARKRAS